MFFKKFSILLGLVSTIFLACETKPVEPETETVRNFTTDSSSGNYNETTESGSEIGSGEISNQTLADLSLIMSPLLDGIENVSFNSTEEGSGVGTHEEIYGIGSSNTIEMLMGNAGNVSGKENSTETDSGNSTTTEDQVMIDESESGSGIGDTILSAIQDLLHFTHLTNSSISNGTEEAWTTDSTGTQIPALMFA